MKILDKLFNNHHEEEFNRRWGDLAIYNAEKGRGIVHTPEYVEKMREKQEQYYLYLEREYGVQSDA